MECKWNQTKSCFQLDKLFFLNCENDQKQRFLKSKEPISKLNQRLHQKPPQNKKVKFEIESSFEIGNKTTFDLDHWLSTRTRPNLSTTKEKCKTF